MSFQYLVQLRLSNGQLYCRFGITPLQGDVKFQEGADLDLGSRIVRLDPGVYNVESLIRKHEK